MMAEKDDPVLDAECIGGGRFYVGHGIDLVMVGFTPDVKWWRNSAGFSADQARRLAAILVQQADASDDLAESEPDQGAVG